MSTDAVDKYQRELQEQIEQIKQYRASIQQEYEQQVIDQQQVEYRAKRVVKENAHNAAMSIVDIAMGRVTDTTPATQFQAAKWVYERAIGTDDDPNETEFSKMLSKLQTPVEELAETDGD